MSDRHTARLAAFVILERDGKIVLARRANTGYMDGKYQMPSGHVEADEHPSEAAVRETKEETGVDIKASDLEFVHCSYRINKVDAVGDYVDFFFRATRWEGEPMNAEPEKCDEVAWFPIDALPENTVPVVRKVVDLIRDGVKFSEIIHTP